MNKYANKRDVLTRDAKFHCFEAKIEKGSEMNAGEEEEEESGRGMQEGKRRRKSGGKREGTWWRREWMIVETHTWMVGWLVQGGNVVFRS